MKRHLAQANGHIADLKVQIARQRVIVKYARAHRPALRDGGVNATCARREPRCIREASRTGPGSLKAPVRVAKRFATGLPHTKADHGFARPMMSARASYRLDNRHCAGDAKDRDEQEVTLGEGKTATATC
jgi:hypothetical protein